MNHVSIENLRAENTLAELCSTANAVAVEEDGRNCMYAMSREKFDSFRETLTGINGRVPAALDEVRIADTLTADGVVLLDGPAFEDFLWKAYEAREISRAWRT